MLEKFGHGVAIEMESVCIFYSISITLRTDMIVVGHGDQVDQPLPKQIGISATIIHSLLIICAATLENVTEVACGTDHTVSYPLKTNDN